ncbi:hypothetical protein O1611_g964 [Lasiodiplodia mahajangana]|uniref:Uncharacterized protein n=1 Tax=Lasiodiplodia mahajangana TaxID=1108764 RepID=A0ACC2JZ30_9PEZI|nr:hypothetical protein O1611_g964 [Lasiodiplodia mahajangana]
MSRPSHFDIPKPRRTSSRKLPRPVAHLPITNEPVLVTVDHQRWIGRDLVTNPTGGTLRGTRTEVAGMDEYERKEYLRKNRRRPIEETIADIGEGRGIEPPGYEERRRERLKEKYGVEIKPVSTLVD